MKKNEVMRLIEDNVMRREEDDDSEDKDIYVNLVDFDKRRVIFLGFERRWDGPNGMITCIVYREYEADTKDELSDYLLGLCLIQNEHARYVMDEEGYYTGDILVDVDTMHRLDEYCGEYEHVIGRLTDVISDGDWHIPTREELIGIFVDNH